MFPKELLTNGLLNHLLVWVIGEIKKRRQAEPGADLWTDADIHNMATKDIAATGEFIHNYQPTH